MFSSFASTLSQKTKSLAESAKQNISNLQKEFEINATPSSEPASSAEGSSENSSTSKPTFSGLATTALFTAKSSLLALKENIVQKTHEFENEQKQFIEKNREAGEIAPPDETASSSLNSSTENLEELIPQSELTIPHVLRLSRDTRNLLVSPPSTSNFDSTFNLKDPLWQKRAVYLLERDAELKSLRWSLVPSKIHDDIFWRNYFYRVSLILQSAELGQLEPVSLPPSPVEVEEKEVLFDADQRSPKTSPTSSPTKNQKEDNETTDESQPEPEKPELGSETEAGVEVTQQKSPTSPPPSISNDSSYPSHSSAPLSLNNDSESPSLRSTNHRMDPEEPSQEQKIQEQQKLSPSDDLATQLDLELELTLSDTMLGSADAGSNPPLDSANQENEVAPTVRQPENLETETKGWEDDLNELAELLGESGLATTEESN
ncbi:hypothetical protein BKA69DRAFT_623826 [Paraphysoderma sedebokerense]|nr:hypothetical protein BKA69DRAFT_623826 [Paraphysoderma sedebokerense]